MVFIELTLLEFFSEKIWVKAKRENKWVSEKGRERKKLQYVKEEEETLNDWETFKRQVN